MITYGTAPFGPLMKHEEGKGVGAWNFSDIEHEDVCSPGRGGHIAMEEWGGFNNARVVR